MVDKNFFYIKGPFPFDYINQLVNGKFVKSNIQSCIDTNLLLKGVNAIKSAGPDEITIVNNSKYQDALAHTKAALCIISPDYNYINYPWLNFIIVPNTKYVLSLLTHLFYEVKLSSSNSQLIHSNAKIGKNCFLGSNVVIEENVVIGDNAYIDHNSVIKYGVQIGDNVRIGSNVFISFALIGNNVNILPGAKIGQEGFGFATQDNKHYKILHTGRVIIGDDVEIGANTTIDRGSNSQDTVIGNNVMIDNLVQIGHNVSIGEGSIIVAQVGIAGSSKLGNYCVVGGQVGIAGHLEIDNFVQIGAQSGVIKNVAAKSRIIGSPAISAYDWHKQNVKLKILADSYKN